jgi:hypothetical protein
MGKNMRKRGREALLSEMRCLELLDRERFVYFQQEDKLDMLELRS